MHKKKMELFLQTLTKDFGDFGVSFAATVAGRLLKAAWQNAQYFFSVTAKLTSILDEHKKNIGSVPLQNTFYFP